MSSYVEIVEGSTASVTIVEAPTPTVIVTAAAEANVVELPGSTGPIGPQGPQGPQGIQGIAGSPGYYGAFQDVTTQTVTDPTIAYAMQIGITDENNGVSIVDGSKIKFNYAGVYNIQFSAQIVNPESNIYNVFIWFRKNGIDIVDSCSDLSVTAKHGGKDGALVAAWNYVTSVNANDYVQIMWGADHENLALAAIPAGTSPVRPKCPSIIVTATQVAPG